MNDAVHGYSERWISEIPGRVHTEAPLKHQADQAAHYDDELRVAPRAQRNTKSTATMHASRLTLITWDSSPQ